MEVTVWTDYLCPWAYGARPRTDWLAANGADVRYRAYELHPDIPPGGRPVRPGGRLDRVFDHIAEECRQSGLDFVKPQRSPNTRLPLEILELLQETSAEAAAHYDEQVARAHWVDGVAIDDPAELARLTAAAIGDRHQTSELLARFEAGDGAPLVDRSRELAHDVGVTATPAWRIGEFTLTGLHPAPQFERWMRRILNKT